MDNLERKIRTLCHCFRDKRPDTEESPCTSPCWTDFPDIFNNSTPAESLGGAKDYDKAMECLSDHFKFRKNAPMARQAFSAATPTVGETINNFITRLQKLAEHREYEGERDNQVRDRAISFIKDINLKSKIVKRR